MNNLRNTSLGIIVSVLLVACGGGAPGPGQQDPPVTGPAAESRVSAEALHGCTLDGITVTELPDAVSVEFAKFASPGKFIRLSFQDDVWPDAETVDWTIQGDDRNAVATAVAVDEHSANIGLSAATGSSPHPAAITIAVRGAPPSKSEPGPPVLAATAELLSVTDLGDERVKLDWVQALPGDFDFNGKVELADLAVLADHLGETVEADAEAPAGSPLYWLDSNRDGQISPADGDAISQNLLTELTGFVIARNSAEIDPEAPGTVSVSTEQSTTTAGRPPAYSVELTGSAEADWGVAAVDIRGRIGSPRIPLRRGIDLLAKINLFGIELFSFPEIADQGRRPGKIGARVIEPIDVVHRGTISTPQLSDDTTFKFSGLPRDRELLLDVNYVPKETLDSGMPVQLEIGPVESLSLVEERAATAVPFNLSGGSGPGQLTIDIFFLPNPAGGYWIEVNAISAMPGDQLPRFHHTLLDYGQGVLNFDVDGDSQFEPGWYFPDGDRDNVSDSWIEMNIQLDEFGYVPEETYSIEATVLGVNQQSNVIELGQITWYDTPVLSDPLQLNYSEETLILAPASNDDPLLTPDELEAGAVVNAVFYLLRDPGGILEESYWLDQLFLLETEP